MFRLNKYISVNILNLQGQKENWTNSQKSLKLSGRKIWFFCLWAKTSKTDIFNNEAEREVEGVKRKSWKKKE